MRVAVVSPVAVPPARSGPSARILRLTSWLKSQGHTIHFVWAQTDATKVPSQVSGRLASTWASTSVLPHAGRPSSPADKDWGLDDWIDPSHEQPFREAMAAFRPDAVLVNYVFLSRFLDWAPQRALRYLDTHDRLSRREVYEQAGIKPGFYWTTVEEELRGCRRADVVLAIQDREAPHFARAGRPVVTVGHHESATASPDPSSQGRLAIGFLAAYNKFNVESFLRLNEELERTSLLDRHDARFVVAGGLVQGCLDRGQIDYLPRRMENMGPVADLDDFYDRVDLVVNPTVVGTGLKIKSIEAMARGKPLVSTAIGTDGLPARSPFHRATGIPQLVAQLDELLSWPHLLPGLANTSRHIHAEYQLNLEHNLHNLFSQRALEAHRSDSMASYVHHTTVRLDESDEHRSLTLADPILRLGTPTHIAHVINPVPASLSSDLYSAQPVTLESMRRAAEFAKAHSVDVDLLSCVAKGDGDLRVPGFRTTSTKADLVSSLREFRHPRPLPLLRSILDNAASDTDAEWLVYTNADIALMPHFYTFIAERIRDGHDAIVINRRTIPRDRMSVRDLNHLYSQLGEKHPGFDCFVFRRDRLPDFELGNVSLAVHLVGRVLLWNLLAYAANPLIVTEGHLTFHLGNDTAWSRPELLDYTEHNTDEAINVLETLESQGRLSSIRQNCDEGFRRKVFSLAFDPRVLRDRRGLRPRMLAERPVFVHALFRTGSTFLWHRMRSGHHFRAFYEPLHEALAQLRPENLDRARSRYTLDTRHTFEGDWLFREYEELLDAGLSGVRSYRSTFAYEGFADNSPQPALRRYIDGLLDQAGTDQTVLQFNRSALRQRWFHREYPEAHHLYLVRAPREQWASYLSFMKNGARGFNRNDAIIAGMNQDRSLVRPLRQLVPLRHDTSIGNYFARYDATFDAYSWHQRYALFYFIWLQGLLEAAWTGSRITDMNAVATSPWERLRLENYLRTRGAAVNLKGLTMTAYDPDDLPLTPDELGRVERTVHAAVGRAQGLARVRRLPPAWQQLGQSIISATLDRDLLVQRVPGAEAAVG